MQMRLIRERVEGSGGQSQYGYASPFGYGMVCLLAIVLIACSL